MAWIESHQELARHPKTKRLARLLNISLPAAVGHLHFFWWWALDYAQDGNISKYDEHDIADACGWDGDAVALQNALIESGFIDLENDDLLIHDWHEYAGRLVEKREQNKERKRKSRARHATVTPHQPIMHGDSNGGHRATEPNTTQPNQTEHKEDIVENKFSPDSPEYILTQFLISKMLENNQNAKIPKSLDKWIDAIEKLHRIDNYSHEQIREVIEWSQSDEFWKGNILSGTKLREKMPTLVLQMQRNRKPDQPSPYQRTKNKLQQMYEEAVARESNGNH